MPKIGSLCRRRKGRIFLMCDMPILCLIPDEDFFITSDWSSIGGEVRSRRVLAALTNIFTYDKSYNQMPIRDWKAAKENYAISISLDMEASGVKALMTALAPPDPGLWVFNGTSDHNFFDLMAEHPECRSPFVKYRQHTGPGSNTPTHLPGGHRIVHGGLVASCATTSTDIQVFYPETGPRPTYLLGWFPLEDSLVPIINRRWDAWPAGNYEPFLPEGPSPSENSVELVAIGIETEGIGIFGNEPLQEWLSPARLRQILGEEAILAGISRSDFDLYLQDRYDFSSLHAVDRDLPF